MTLETVVAMVVGFAVGFFIVGPYVLVPLVEMLEAYIRQRQNRKRRWWE